MRKSIPILLSITLGVALFGLVGCENKEPEPEVTVEEEIYSPSVVELNVEDDTIYGDRKVLDNSELTIELDNFSVPDEGTFYDLVLETTVTNHKYEDLQMLGYIKDIHAIRDTIINGQATYSDINTMKINDKQGISTIVYSDTQLDPVAQDFQDLYNNAAVNGATAKRNTPTKVYCYIKTNSEEISSENIWYIKAPVIVANNDTIDSLIKIYNEVDSCKGEDYNRRSVKMKIDGGIASWEEIWDGSVKSYIFESTLIKDIPDSENQEENSDPADNVDTSTTAE